MVWFIEFLTIRTWVWSVLPHLLRWVATGHRAPHGYVFESSRAAMALARASARLMSMTIETLPFRLRDIRDEQGLSLRLRIAFQDLAAVQADAMTEPQFHRLLHDGNVTGRLPMCLGKGMATIVFSRRGTLWRMLLTIQICLWKLTRDRRPPTDALLFLERRPWFPAIERYASRCGLAVIPVPPVFDTKQWLRRRIPPPLMAVLGQVVARWRAHGPWAVLRGRLRSLGMWARRPGPVDPATARRGHRTGPRLAVEYYGDLNLEHPEHHSNLFFWQQSSLSGRDLLLLFKLPVDPIDERKWAALTTHGIGAVALSDLATTVPQAPVFTYRPPRWRTQRDQGLSGVDGRGLEGAWLSEQIMSYSVWRDYWTALFTAYGIKMYLTWFKYDESHCAIADALESVGGVTAMYQWAYDSHPSPETAIAVDVFFGFSHLTAELERRSRSIIPYCVITGYLGDHRFSLLREETRRVRRTIQQHGATRILAFTDEGSKDDSRWTVNHHGFMQESYAFLLEKVLAEPWLGLVVKPKHPATLRRRLGPVAELLTRAEATGRCFVYGGGVLRGAYPPAAAALTADVAIHGHLCAGTAGMEAALAGVPTLLLDREGWSVSPLYRLGVGRVVFTEWERIWHACLEHWKRPGGVPGFGDWSSMLDELDPFRDGRAAERMGTYLAWLLEGFKAGGNRDTVMADAAERYRSIWGKDKIIHIDTGDHHGLPVKEQAASSVSEDALALSHRGMTV